MWPPKCVLLAHACYGEWLTGEAGQQHIVIGNFSFVACHNIAHNGVRFPIVGDVCLLRPLIPFACEYAFPASAFETNPHSTNAGEQVYKGKARRSETRDAAVLENLTKRGLDVYGALRDSPFPTRDRLRINPKTLSEVSLREALPNLAEQK
jgi:hypothetical protein